MIYRLLAEAVLAVHFGFILFVIFGGLLVLRWRWAARVHLPAALWGVWIMYAGWICPLTPLENHFRRQAGLEGYEGGFIENYLLSVIYPDGITPGVQIVLGTLLLVFNLTVYGLAWRRRDPPALKLRRPSKRAATEDEI